MVVRPMGVVEPLPLVVARTGQVLVRQGEACLAPSLIESGVLEATIVDADGHTFLLDLLGPGDVVGGYCGASPCTVTARRPARLRSAGHEADEALAAQAERTAAIATHLAWFGVEERIERRLLDLAMRLGRPVPGGTQLPVRITQDDLASMVGATRESANRAIQRLRARGAIDVVGRGRYVVRAPLRLVSSAS